VHKEIDNSFKSDITDLADGSDLDFDPIKEQAAYCVNVNWSFAERRRYNISGLRWHINL